MVFGVALCNTIAPPGRKLVFGPDLGEILKRKHQNRPSGRPSAGRRADFEYFPAFGRPESRFYVPSSPSGPQAARMR